MQADGNWFHNDVLDNAPSSTNDKRRTTEFEQRRAGSGAQGKGHPVSTGSSATTARTTSGWTNPKWKLGTSHLQAGQFKQPNSMEELASTKNNDFVSKAMVTNPLGLSRRVGVARATTSPTTATT